jgi:hypothetical protein
MGVKVTTAIITDILQELDQEECLLEVLGSKAPVLIKSGIVLVV